MLSQSLTKREIFEREVLPFAIDVLDLVFAGVFAMTHEPRNSTGGIKLTINFEHLALPANARGFSTGR